MTEGESWCGRVVVFQLHVGGDRDTQEPRRSPTHHGLKSALEEVL